MFNTKSALLGAAAASLMALAASPASAANPLIIADEHGDGVLQFSYGTFAMPGVLASDPGPGGLGSVLTYNLQGPPSLVAGDLLIYVGSVFDDVVRFNPAGAAPGYAASLVFYSNPSDGFDSLADTPSPPGAFYSNTLTLQEVNGSVVYQPLAGQPGYVAGFNTVYDLSSGAPEPAIWATMLLGFGLAGAALRRRTAIA